MKATKKPVTIECFKYDGDLMLDDEDEIYLKEDADKVIADLEESHKMEVEQLLMEIVKLKAQKAQADKLIAELKDEASTAHRVCSRQIQQIASNEQEIRHHKYKRCLAMAEMLEHICSITIRKAKWKGKWHMRWLELAEKFKPNLTPRGNA